MPADDVTPIPLLAASLRLTAVPTAVPCSRMFVRVTLTRWKLKQHIDDTALIMSELVTNAIKASGITDPGPKPWQIKAEHVIGIQLRAVEENLYAEVWDRTAETPVRKNPNVEAEGGRGLLLVEQLATRWNIYRPNVGGKVVWAELPLGLAVKDVPFDQLHSPVRLPGDIRAESGPVEQQARTALFERLMDTTVEAMAAARVDDCT